MSLCTTLVTSTIRWCLLQKVLWTGTKKGFMSTITKNEIPTFDVPCKYGGNTKLSWVLCDCVLIAFLMPKNVATIPRCRLLYPRKNGEKDPRFYIFPFNLVLTSYNPIKSFNFVRWSSTFCIKAVPQKSYSILVTELIQSLTNWLGSILLAHSIT